jgi:hypothetical protein
MEAHGTVGGFALIPLGAIQVSLLLDQFVQRPNVSCSIQAAIKPLGKGAPGEVIR